MQQLTHLYKTSEKYAMALAIKVLNGEALSAEEKTSLANHFMPTPKPLVYNEIDWLLRASGVDKNEDVRIFVKTGFAYASEGSRVHRIKISEADGVYTIENYKLKRYEVLHKYPFGRSLDSFFCDTTQALDIELVKQPLLYDRGTSNSYVAVYKLTAKIGVKALLIREAYNGKPHGVARLLNDRIHITGPYGDAVIAAWRLYDKEFATSSRSEL